MESVLLVGHSFVKHLSVFCGMPSVSVPVDVSAQIGVSRTCKCFLYSQLGYLISDLSNLEHSPIISISDFDHVIIELGTNDLVSRLSLSSVQLAEELFAYALRLLNGFGVKQVTLGLVLDRAPKKLRGLGWLSFNRRRRNFNRRIVALCRGNPAVNFNQHPGLSGSYEGWSSDGIHPNYASMEKYRKGIRRTVFRAVNQSRS